MAVTGIARGATRESTSPHSGVLTVEQGDRPAAFDMAQRQQAGDVEAEQRDADHDLHGLMLAENG